MARVTREGIPFVQAVSTGAFCEPAESAVDFQALCTAMKELRYDGLAIIEQDMYPVAFDIPLAIATRSRQFYRSVGFG